MATPSPTPSHDDSAQAPEYDKRSKIALGVAVICGLFLLETVQAHRISPQAASPFVWSLLGSVAVGALLYALWCKAKVRKRG